MSKYRIRKWVSYGGAESFTIEKKGLLFWKPLDHRGLCIKSITMERYYPNLEIAIECLKEFKSLDSRLKESGRVVYEDA